MQKVSLYIPVYNCAAYLDRVLNAVFRQTVPFSEVILVDDGSRDETVAIAQQYAVTIVRHSENRGIGAARNTGIAQCSCEFVASVDGDCVPDLRWLERCLSVMADERVLGVGGKLLDGDLRRVADEWRAVNLKQHFGERTKKVPFLPGSNTVYRKKALYACGLYDPQCMRHHEDTVLSKKMIAYGDLIYCAEAQVWHCKKDTWRSVMRSCWGFRHETYPRSLPALGRSVLRELRHAVSLLIHACMYFRWRLLLFDGSYFFIQTYFCLRAYMVKSTNFE